MSGDVRTGAGAEQRNQTAKKAYTSLWAWALFLVPAILGLAIDLWVKSYAFPLPWENTRQGMMYAGRHPAIDPTLLQPNPPIPIIPHVLGFTTTVNGGAVFGSFQGHVTLFLTFSVLALGVILWVFVTSGARHRMVHLALGLITAGALGNLYDRAKFQGVRDMLRFYVDWYPYIFNIADVLLCVGVPLLIVRWMFVKDEKNETNVTGARI